MHSGLLLLLLAVIGLSVATQTLNVHVIAHTHDDVGWLKTVDEYYYGANNRIQDARVQYILDSVVWQLTENPEFRFSYCEMAFFERWWREQTEDMKNVVRQLVASGQLEFINGGWSMNDESGVTYESVVEQMSLGLEFLETELNTRPRVGWQIDPFGHSNTMASLFAQMGYDAVFFARIDYQDYELRSAEKRLEYVWRGSTNFGRETELFTHSMWGTTYCWPERFAFENQGVDPVMTEPWMFGYNLPNISDAFADNIRERAAVYATNNILFEFGCDFAHTDAGINRKNMQYIIDYINANSAQYNLNVFWSTPSTYVDAVYGTGIVLTTKTDDNFPYGSSPHSYWTGYMTSRPTFKHFVRRSTAMLMAAEQLYTFVNTTSGSPVAPYSGIYRLREAHGIAQHHDAISGTAKQPVNDDYCLRLSLALDEVYATESSLIGSLLSVSTPFSFCPLLNESICTATTTAPPSSSEVIPIAFYNPVAWDRAEIMRILVSSCDIVISSGSSSSLAFDCYANEDNAALFWAAFPVSLNPLGTAVYTLRYTKATSATTAARRAALRATKTGSQPVVLDNGLVRVEFDVNGLISFVTDKTTGVTSPLTQTLLWYNASNGFSAPGPADCDNSCHQPSGAYIFRPNSSTAFPCATGTGSVVTFAFQGQFVQEVRQTFSPWVSQIVRLYANATSVELVPSVGPIDISDGLGKEIIMRVSTMNSSTNPHAVFYTDAEGLEMQQRIINYRPTWVLNVTEPVAGNYYPVNNIIFTNTSAAPNTAVGIVTTKSEGGSGLSEGELEVMIHRRLLYDDYFGVGEPLNETTNVRPPHYLFVAASDAAARRYRPLAFLQNHPVVMMYGAAAAAAAPALGSSSSFSPLAFALPPNLALTTLRVVSPGQVLVRLVNIFSAGEDAELGVPASVDLGALFAHLFSIDSITDMIVTGNAPYNEVSRLYFNSTSTAAPVYPRYPLSGNTVTVRPMEIRTLLLSVTSH